MLVLKRKIGEQLVIPSCDLTLTVHSIKGSSVQVGISAPRSTAVVRQEVRRDVGAPRADSARRD
jgi:carbon storage regulator CsrA